MDTVRFIDLDFDACQNYVAINNRGVLKIFNVNNTNQNFIFHRNIESIFGLNYFKNSKKLIVSIVNNSNDEDGPVTFIYDAATFHLLDSSSVSISSNAFYNTNETLIYDYSYDSLGNQSLIAFSTTNYNIVNIIPFSQLGNNSGKKLLYSGVRGKALIGYKIDAEDASIFAHYQMIDLNDLQAYQDISVSYKSDAYLTKDANYIIVEEEGYSINSLGNERYRPGHIKIYSSTTGNLKASLTLPEDGKVYLFDNYPEKLFYYIEKNNQSIT
ncbi:MAG: hypothetical protein H3C35_10100, partial [Bacteroidetes bacterium]|nr:hypothetical protein [Bacteroidota bacterium]